MDIALAVEKILYAAEYQGVVTDNTEDSWNKVVWGENYVLNEDGTRKLDKDSKPILMPKPTWAELLAVAPDPLGAAKSEKLEEVLAAYTEAFSTISKIYPDFEREGWSEQKEEAKAILENPEATAPILSRLVVRRNRNETMTELATKVLANAIHWRNIYADLTGEQQRMYYEVCQLKTVEEVEKYEVKYDVDVTYVY